MEELSHLPLTSLTEDFLTGRGRVKDTVTPLTEFRHRNSVFKSFIKLGNFYIYGTVLRLRSFSYLLKIKSSVSLDKQENSHLVSWVTFEWKIVHNNSLTSQESGHKVFSGLFYIFVYKNTDILGISDSCEIKSRGYFITYNSTLDLISPTWGKGGEGKYGSTFVLSPKLHNLSPKLPFP